MRKPKSMRRDENVFSTPFSLSQCRMWLRAQQKPGMFPDTVVKVTSENPEMMTFIVYKYAANVKGRLDMFTTDSTLVSTRARVDWLYLALTILLWSPIIFVASGVLFAIGAMLFPHLHQIFTDSGQIILGYWLLLAGIVLICIWWQARRNLRELVGKVNDALRSPLVANPDVEAIEANVDGELVPAPPLNQLADTPQDLDDLLHNKTKW